MNCEVVKSEDMLFCIIAMFINIGQFSYLH